MKTAIMKLADIRPADYNPRVALKAGDPEYEALKNSLDRFGLVEPLVYNATTGTLVSGHQRLNALLDSGKEEAEVVIIEVDEDKEKLLNIAINKIDGDWDYKKLEALFEDIGAEDIKFTGFTTDELDKLFESDEFDEDFDDEEDEDDDTESDAGDDYDEEDDAEERPKPFHVFLSFPTKERAEKWLKDHGVEEEYKDAVRNITINMEGIEYGTRH